MVVQHCFTREYDDLDKSVEWQMGQSWGSGGTFPAAAAVAAAELLLLLQLLFSAAAAAAPSDVAVVRTRFEQLFPAPFAAMSWSSSLKTKM